MNEVRKAKRLWLLRGIFCLVMGIVTFLPIGLLPFLAKPEAIGLRAFLLIPLSMIGVTYFLSEAISSFSSISKKIEKAEKRREKNIKDALVCIANEDLKGKKYKNEILS